MERDVGVVNGRMHPPHLGHMEYITKSYRRCDYLVVGLTNPDPRMIVYDETDPKRSSDQANPFTFYQRLQMIRKALDEHNIPVKDFVTVPFPINYPRRLQYYAPSGATHFITIYDEWGKKKKALLESQGLKVEVLWNRAPSEKIATGTDIRRKIATGGDWKSAVPKSVADYIIKNDLDKRVTELWEEDNH